MKAKSATAGMDIKTRLSVLWIVVMFNMAFADIFNFMIESTAGTGPEVQVSQVAMLVFAMILEIPLIMILLSRILKYSANRWLNIIASVITTAFVIIGGSWTQLSYMFFAGVEIVCMAFIVWVAWNWRNAAA